MDYYWVARSVAQHGQWPGVNASAAISEAAAAGPTASHAAFVTAAPTPRRGAARAAAAPAAAAGAGPGVGRARRRGSLAAAAAE
jgi:hypothetical protein